MANLSRRTLLKRSSLLALAPTVPGFLAQLARAVEAKADDRVLVVVQLDGGNDGINTVVPYADEGYSKHRERLRLPAQRLCKLDDDVALHPSMQAMADLFEKQRLTIVQGVGYPNPNRSHDVSMAIWHTARFDREEHKSGGWLGRALDQLPPQAGAPGALLVGEGTLPAAVMGRRSVAGSFSRLDELAVQNVSARAAAAGDTSDGELEAFVRRATLDTYTTADALAAAAARERGKATYPASQLAQQLGMVARLIEADLPTRVYYVVHSGYDTHAAQIDTHARLLDELSGSLAAFVNDLTQAKLAERVLLMTFSEFGRRVTENASAGTDHGTAGPMFLAGGPVRGGLFGDRPRLLDLEAGDLKMSVDFRRVYAAVLRDWLNVRPQLVLGGDFEPLKVLSM
ncbi:MAG TPA: DUF1501 domain-containing protein [Pirellulales bacterium]|jgi:uncharacterized protein (DUF1501 family)|nr:DUF1501 domain-containing protein [Pirellulales bacterium]